MSTPRKLKVTAALLLALPVLCACGSSSGGGNTTVGVVGIVLRDLAGVDCG